MARACAICKCDKCGKEFNVYKGCANRTDAERFEEWAKENCTTCSDCNRVEKEETHSAKRQKWEELYNGFVLPKIKGVSDKQMAYAESLRRKLFISYESEMKGKYNRFKNALSDEFAAACEAKGMDVEETRQQYLHTNTRSGRKLLIAMTETEAGKIIEALK